MIYTPQEIDVVMTLYHTMLDLHTILNKSTTLYKFFDEIVIFAMIR